MQRKGSTFQVSQNMIDQMRQNKVGEDGIKGLQAAPVKQAQPATSPYKKESEQVKGEPDAAFKQAEVTSEGIYGCPVNTHCCLETHGSISEWADDDHLFARV